jgi:transcriptional regulator with XRE-family HTH domain
VTDPQVCGHFAENMKRARLRAGLSQEELGFRASLHRTEIGQLERGIRMPRLDTILRLAGGLGIPPCELLDGMAWRVDGFRAGAYELADRSNAGGSQ